MELLEQCFLVCLRLDVRRFRVGLQESIELLSLHWLNAILIQPLLGYRQTIYPLSGADRETSFHFG